MKAINRRNRNKIISLQNDQREWVEDEETLKRMVNDYYPELFKQHNNNSQWYVTRCNFPMMEKVDMERLFLPLENTEIKNAVFPMSP